MTDIAGALLEQYYGFSKNPKKTRRFLSIHECANNIKNDKYKLTDEQSIADTNDDNSSKEVNIQASNLENVENNFDDDVPTKSSRILWECEVFEDNEKTSGFDIILEGDATSNLHENINSRKEKSLSLRTFSTILDPEDKEENNLCLSPNEDVSPDSASDISLRMEKKKSFKFSYRFASPLTTPRDKTPIYNETFIDLASTGLVSLPIKIIRKYFTIRMLYLENNNLSEVPEELFVSLPQLQWLDIRNNQLRSLPTSIRSHPSIETILLEGNEIETLPLELCLVPKLKILNVARNPIIAPPEDIIALGCSSILNYLRVEWNKLHPDESVKFVEQRIEPRLSTILCYQSPRKKRLVLPKILQRISKSANDIGDSSKNASVRKRSRAYKPSNRYDGKETNLAMEQRIYWSSKARDLFSAQSATIQKIKDSDMIKEWRRDRRSFDKSMEKVSRRNEDDIPFAIDIKDYPAINEKQKVEKYVQDQKSNGRLKLTPSMNINEKLLELSKSLEKLEIKESSEILTAKSKQKYLHSAIEKLSHFQKKIQILRRHNEIFTPMNSPNNSSYNILS